jgi:hypothetical protein
VLGDTSVRIDGVPASLFSVFNVDERQSNPTRNR